MIDRWAPIIDRVELVSSRGGSFKVMCDDSVVFDRKALGRHAAQDEIEGLLGRFLGPRLEWK
ncbi:MAG: hypothetical protein NVS9B1_08910 [Candidatus Dormibacteraceae bacterium]